MCWTSAVAAGGRRPSRSPSATAATRWFRRLPVCGRRFARDAGRSPATRRRRTASDALEADGPASSRINPASRPRSKRWWTRSRAATRPRRYAGRAKSRAKLAAALTEQGWRVSSTTVGRLLLYRLGYWLQSARKRQEGATHPDRNAQFEHINQTADEHLAAGQPVVSVDTKKKELVGNFKERRAGMTAEGHAAGGAGPYARRGTRRASRYWRSPGCSTQQTTPSAPPSTMRHASCSPLRAKPSPSGGPG